ncbi:MAG: N-acetyltransferase family protein [Candidatus Woesearchaeota archaeon]
MVSIRRATSQDASILNASLRLLSKHLGDAHRASDDELRGALERGLVHAFLAEEDGVVGVVLFSAVFSTTRGSPGVYVSDLWVTEDHRHEGLGSELLEAARSYSREAWNASYLSLVVYDENEDACAFYRALGFKVHGRFLVR